MLLKKTLGALAMVSAVILTSAYSCSTQVSVTNLSDHTIQVWDDFIIYRTDGTYPYGNDMELAFRGAVTSGDSRDLLTAPSAPAPDGWVHRYRFVAVDESGETLLDETMAWEEIEALDFDIVVRR
jgi:hypothetical protein